MSFTGALTSQMELAVMGVIFVALLALAIAVNPQLLRSPATVFEGCLAYWVGQAPFYLLGWGANGSFSMLSLPTESYLSILSQIPSHFQAMINRSVAPTGENLLILGFMGVIYKMLRDEGVPWPIAFVISLGMGMGTFALMHGHSRNPTFYLKAGLVMGIMQVLLFGEDIGLFSIRWIPITLGFTIGIHAGINRVMAGGLISYWEVLYYAPPDAQWMTVLLLSWDVVTLLLGVIGAYLFYRAFVPLPNLGSVVRGVVEVVEELIPV